ncbi:MAG: isoprenyl transferase [Sporomusaceae bacterium]|nr:isoprenyl transferase [Sporomusaceae bacterium]
MWKKWFGKTEEYVVADNQLDKAKLPRHTAIIMDGNGRWAKDKGLPRVFGHRAGVEALRRVVRTASNLGLQALTVYAFSTENWKRPHEEVNLLMELFSTYLTADIDELDANNVQLRFIGRIDALAPALRDKFLAAQERTAVNSGLIFNAAINYGGRAELLRAAQLLAADVQAGRLAAESLTEADLQQHLYTADLPDVDLLIRPSGDYRISNFLLWQSAYAELWFTDVRWPDFSPAHLLQAITDFQQRDRRFGGLKIK